MSFESIQEVFCRNAERFGPRVAVEQGGRQTTYDELESRSNRLANFLLSQSTEKGARVALLLDDRAEVVAGMLGALKAGCLFVPLDPALPARRLATLIAEVRPQWIVTEPQHWHRLLEIENESGVGARVIAIHGEESCAPASRTFPRASFANFGDTGQALVSPQPDDPCYIVFTSGSTGRPKGIVGRLKGIDHFVRWEIETFDVPEGARVSQLTTPSFDAFLRDVFVPLSVGGTVCPPGNREILFEGRRLAAWIEEARLDLLHCVPSVFRALLQERLTPESFPSLRYVLIAGEPLLPADVKKWSEVFGERIRLVNLYGPSETTMTKLFYLVEATDGDRPTIPIGKPMKGAAAMAIDAKGRPCAPGQVGEILIRTPYMSHGYWERPDQTDEVFIPNPFGQGREDRVYKTGDLGRVQEDGNFEFLGRKDQQVKIRGVRVEIQEIESLLREHPAVRDLAVAAQDDPQGNKYLCAYVVLGQKLAPGTLRDYLAGLLPESMVPSFFVQMDELPRTLTGKVDLRALPVPAEALAERGGAFEPPRNAIEELLLCIWKEILRVERIGVHENFFEWGGHSLLATQVLSRVRQVFDVDLPLRTFFEHPTVAGLARAVEVSLRSGEGSELPDLVPVPHERPLPLSFAQQRLWFIERLDPGSPTYNIPIFLRLRGLLSLPALGRSIDDMVRRHEGLRVSFVQIDGQPAQVVHAPVPFVIPCIDVRGLSEDVRRSEVFRLAGEEARTPFDLGRGLLLRVTLLRLQEEEHVVLFTMHHIASDAWSMGLLVGDFVALYEAYSNGTLPALPELPLQYADFAHWQRQWLREEALQEHLAYWRQRLAGLRNLELPADRARTEKGAHRAGRRFWALPEDLSRELDTFSSRHSVTLFMTLLASFDVLLSYLTRQDDIVVGTDIANRNHLGTERMIGFFINQLVLRTDLSGNPGFVEILRRVREVNLGAYAHQDLPFEKLVEELRPDRSAGRAPLFQVKLVLQNAPVSALELPGMKITLMPLGSGVAQFDLLINLTASQEGLAGWVEYSAELFDEETITRFLELFELVLATVAANPVLSLTELHDILREADSRRLGSKWQELKQTNFQKLQTARRRTVALPALNATVEGEEALLGNE